MGLQIWTSDQTPQLTAQAGRAIGRGIEQFGAGIGGGLHNLRGRLDQMAAKVEKQEEEEKHELQRGKAAESFFKSSPELQKQTGISLDRFASMSAQDKQATVLGALSAQSFAEGARRAKAADFAEQNQAKQPAYMKRAAELMRPQAPEPGAEGPTMPGLSAFEASARASGDTGFVPPMSSVDDWFRMGDRTGGSGAALPPRGLPLGDTRVVPGVGTFVGSGENYEPQFRPEPRPEKPPEETAPDYKWIYEDDPPKFKNALMRINDPRERDRVLKTRAEYLRAQGKGGNELADILRAVVPGGAQSPQAAPQPAASTPSPGGGKLVPGENGKWKFVP